MPSLRAASLLLPRQAASVSSMSLRSAYSLLGSSGSPPFPIVTPEQGTVSFLPATGQLGGIAGRGLYGCRQGPFQGTDWVEEGCRHLEPGVMAVHGLRPGRQSPGASR